jgi:S-adenosylmethionine hydrolase
MRSGSLRRRVTLLVSLVAVMVATRGRVAAAQESAKTPENRPAIVFMTDFGTANDAVAICKAVIIGIAPQARIMDITHQVTPFSIEEGARFLFGVTPYYPPGTVFLVVVDPTVGSARKAIVVKTKKGQLFVLPDNGLITPVADRDGVEGAREITNPAWMIGDKISSTFHGRDIFSPTAAHLAAGEDWALVGAEVKDLVRLQPREAKIDAKGITGEVFALDDPFGSLITDIKGDDFKQLGYSIGDTVKFTIDGKPFAFSFVKTFASVPVGKPLLYIDSRGRLGVALNQRDFSKVYKIMPPASIFVPRKPAQGASR